jgi:predicted signal transduction protein with EAL and GGDEF domain/FixJ family two-component response regulator
VTWFTIFPRVARRRPLSLRAADRLPLTDEPKPCVGRTGACPEPAARAAAPAQGKRRRNVLIIDDDPVFALLASEALQQAGFDTRIAGDAQQAMSAFEDFKPDLTLLDVNLPGGNGFEICATLRSLASGRDLPIVMVTGHNDTESISRAYDAGATDFIHKPVLWPTLPHRVEFMLRALDNLHALRESERRNRALLQALPDTIFMVDGTGVLVEHISGNERNYGRNLVGKTLEEAFPAAVARAARAALGGRNAAAVAGIEFKVRQGEKRRWFEARVRPQADGPLLIVIRDTTERREAKARIEYLAYYDTLTRLPNRQLFVREAARALPAPGKADQLAAVLYLDLDRFKRINDNLGHSIGDALLQEVARRLESIFADAEAIAPVGVPPQAGAGPLRHRIARFGGDEFALLLTGLRDEQQAIDIADRIRNSLAEPFRCDGHRFVITPSIGIALCPRDGRDVEDLLVKADMAMYQAKGRGRNAHAFYGETMGVRSLGRLELENELQHACENDMLQLHYQPKLDLATGRIIGVEALLRWPHAERGWIAPDVFIPVAEETGLIFAIGERVIDRACTQLATWAEEGLGHLSVAVNVSVQQFLRADFVDTVLRALRHHGVAPQRLELEITESLLMQNLQDATAAMRRLREAGIGLSIDDFGTGYSSLGYLRQLPVDALKIDRSFVRDLPQSEDDAAICAAIIAMARELKIKVIAEGVETAEQLDFLRHHRCDQVQGYYIGRPVPVAELQGLRPAP